LELVILKQKLFTNKKRLPIKDNEAYLKLCACLLFIPSLLPDNGIAKCGQQMYRGGLILFCLTLAALSSALSTFPHSFSITLCRMLPPPLSIGKLSLSLSLALVMVKMF
jgi:hypothetical protein